MLKAVINSICKKLQLRFVSYFVLGCITCFATSVDAARASSIQLVPHKALYAITLVSTKSGAQLVNVSGNMYYELSKSCDSWISDHRFNLRYEYSDTPAINVKSNFATYENFEGTDFNFTSTRKRNDSVYEELIGHASVTQEDKSARFKIPENLKFDLSPDAMFPIKHTMTLLEKARTREKFFNAIVFDGSDDQGPVMINAFIGKPINTIAKMPESPKIDANLLNSPAYKIRLAFFPLLQAQSNPDYEMEMEFHENGVAGNMLVEYDTFSVTQKLIALEKLPQPVCDPN